MEEQPAVDPQQLLDRPARKQIPGPVISSNASNNKSEVNIWSGRRLGPRGPDGGSKAERRSRQPSKYRCCVATDTGKTRGSEGQINQFCLFFAKGMCYQGYACTYLHRVPTSADNAAMLRNTSQDIFGREKLPDHLDNRKGAGSYDRDMTTLYVHYGGAGHYATPQLRHLLLENFGEFGPIKRIYIVPAKTIAFVTYHWRASAEFAKEAMDSQTLTGSTMHEVLSVRWSNEDPNPVAVVAKKRAALDAAEAAALAMWDSLPQEEKEARLALMHQAKARKISAVANRMPQQLLTAGAGGLTAGDSREQFDEWRGVPTQEQQAMSAEQTAAADHAGTSVAQQNAAQDHVQQAAEIESWQSDPQWAEYPPEYIAQWQEYYQMQQSSAEQQQHQSDGAATAGGAWYQGWRQRQKPADGSVSAGSDKGLSAAGRGSVGSAAPSLRMAAADTGVVAGLLADYGSDDED